MSTLPGRLCSVLGLAVGYASTCAGKGNFDSRRSFLGLLGAMPD